MKKLIQILLMLSILMISSPVWAQDQTDAECLSFATAPWVLQNTKTGEVGQVISLSFNPPGTCQFTVRFADGSIENKIVLSVSERLRIRAEAMK